MYIYEKQGKAQYLKFLIMDILCILISFVLAYFIRHDEIPGVLSNGFNLYTQVLCVMLTTHVCMTYLMDVHADIDKRGYFREFMVILKQTLFMMFAVLIYIYLTKQADNFSRSVYVALFAIDFFLMYTVRVLCKAWFPSLTRNLNDSQRMYVITRSEYIFDLVAELGDDPSHQLKGLIITDKDMVGREFLGVPVVANEASLYEFMRLAVVDAVFIHLPGEEEEVQVLSEVFTDMGITVHINIEKLPYNIPNKVLHEVGDLTVVSSSMRVATPAQVFVKRCIDIFGALVGLALTAIATIIIGPIIYFESPGPIFFKQTRVGRNGRKFTIYKFRSMYMDAEERKKELMDQNKMNGLMFKMDDDPRITRIGKFIRKTSIDELPQFLNVLKGDMSLVGTRPPTLDEYRQYELHHKKRLSMKPGLTGVWQVSGRSNIVDFEKIVQMDADYISNWSLAMDFKLIFKTVGVLFGDRDAC